MEIDKKIVEVTSQCEKNFVCLNNNKHIYCLVEYCINNKVHFTKCKEKKHCNYKMNFGGSYICNCPVRKEIFNKYGL